ncbi:epidermal retinol dehydrogenase 2-like isoform X1 [Platichthys flesus]|uniref:epidermal retinol dehydrogenase 2-like isoform X1 n=2 Tax=Platichthys flesus TaxID=8260 RepID=UPI001A86DB52|nr:epidermal retinol dehydrogenase 2-like isoform X1 [Platichthys flesus]
MWRLQNALPLFSLTSCCFVSRRLHLVLSLQQERTRCCSVTTPRSIMNIFLETIQVLLLSLWYNVESFIHLFVPRKRKNIAGEVVLLTGAGSGIGRLMAQEFAALGTVLVLWDINHDGMKETARLAKESGASRVHYYLCDCSDRNEVYRVADQVKREVGDVSILVNNAGIVTGKKFMDAPDSLIEKTVEVNTMAHFWTYKAFLPAMIANNHGHLVSIASSAGLIGINGLADYCASKFAAVGFAESVGLELLATGKDGIKTTIVCPYFINTGMFDGCQTKWPTLLPILNPDYVVQKIIHAVLTDQAYLLLPKTMYLIAALKNILPVKQGIMLGQYLGAFNLMENFRGRSKKLE